MNYWSTARRGVLGLSAATIACSIWKKNPRSASRHFNGMHLAEYFIVAKKAGKKVWYDDTRCFINTMLYGFTFWLPMKLDIE